MFPKEGAIKELQKMGMGILEYKNRKKTRLYL